MGEKTVLLGVTGCIAAYKSCEVVRGLQRLGYRVKVVMTGHAARFVGPATFKALTREEVSLDLFDHPGDPVHHVSLAKEADLVLLAPLTANTMAKVACGLADDLLTTTVLASAAPLVIAPAMNTGMWRSPATQANLKTLLDRGAHLVPPASGRLACGDSGEGKLADVEDIVAACDLLLRGEGALAGKRVLVTAGPTHEAIDPVRYIANRSSGKMGYALAEAASAMGADVVLVSGPTHLDAPAGVEVVPVVSAREMRDACVEVFDGCDAAVLSAAVADYTPARPADHKLKKQVEPLDRIELVETEDILATLSSRKGDRVVVGFAAETDDVERYAMRKLARKGCDAIVANDVSRSESTFGSDTNRVLWVGRGGAERLPLMSKRDLAFELMGRVASMLPGNPAPDGSAGA